MIINIPIPELPDPNRPRYQPLADHTFPAASLGAWMQVARDAGVAVIECEHMGALSVRNLLHYEENDDPDVVATMQALNGINASLGDNEMLRWDCCAGFHTKMGMSEGEKPQGDELHLHPGEPRTFDILYEFPADTIDIWKRPWVNAMEIDGFPVEFRAFVVNGEVAGVANYYLQRDLPRNTQIENLATESIRASNAIIEAVIRSQNLPAMPRCEPPTQDRSGINGSLDFLATPDGELLFLEGGPGFGFGAHPCAFLEGDNVAPIEGLKLSANTDAIPFPELFTTTIAHRKSSASP